MKLLDKVYLSSAQKKEALAKQESFDPKSFGLLKRSIVESSFNAIGVNIAIPEDVLFITLGTKLTKVKISDEFEGFQIFVVVSPGMLATTSGANGKVLQTIKKQDTFGADAVGIDPDTMYINFKIEA